MVGCRSRSIAVLVILIAKPFGGYMTRVFDGRAHAAVAGAAPGRASASTQLCGVNEREEQHWLSYAIAMLAFSFAGFVVMYALQRLQNVLPFNPQDQDAVSPDLAFNTSVSFVTNTNWQSYVPETTMSYLTQMAGADGAQLRLGGHRHRARHRADPRLRPAFGADASAISGSI